MGDLVPRLVAVAAVLVVVAVVVAVMWKRASSPSRHIGKVGLPPGAYFFSSASCLECERARGALIEGLGAGGFVELAWESDREVFEELSIDEVPSTLVVDGSGRGTVWRGSPDPMFSSR